MPRHGAGSGTEFVHVGGAAGQARFRAPGREFKLKTWNTKDVMGPGCAFCIYCSKVACEIV